MEQQKRMDANRREEIELRNRLEINPKSTSETVNEAEFVPDNCKRMVDPELNGISDWSLSL